MNLKDQHKQYQNRLIDWNSIIKKAEIADSPYCDKCGCLGNEDCGHTPLFVDCSLSLAGYCNCCSYLQSEVI
ncbi:MAG: hypothetical protein AAB922_02695 [Patescibacteria group bacterium]